MAVRFVYFAGPHGAVLELIARHALDADSPHTGDFHGREILCLGEVGLPTDDVVALAGDLARQFGLQPLGEMSSAFAPMGDHEGLLIVVDGGRPWFPELRQLPGGKGLRITLEGIAGQGAIRDAYGWEVASLVMPTESEGTRWSVF